MSMAKIATVTGSGGRHIPSELVEVGNGDAHVGLGGGIIRLAPV